MTDGDVETFGIGEMGRTAAVGDDTSIVNFVLRISGSDRSC